MRSYVIEQVNDDVWSVDTLHKKYINAWNVTNIFILFG